MTSNIGKNIKVRLAKLGKTSKALAEYAGLSECYISRLCNGDKNIEKVAVGSAIMMADFLECSVYDLVMPPKEDIENGTAKYGLY